MIAASLAIYLVCVYTYPQAFTPPPTSTTTGSGVNGSLHKAEASTYPHDKNRSVDDATEPLLNDDERSFLKILFLGIPDWRNEFYSYFSIGCNVLLALCAVDMIFRAPVLHPETALRFSRVGFVDSNSAKVLFREPDSSQLPVYAYYAQAGSSAWYTVDRVYYLDSDTDYTYPVTYAGLQPSTSYVYSLSNNLTGTFTTAALAGSAGATHLSFLTSSCIKAQFPYNPLAHSMSIPGFKHLSTLLQSLPSPAAFMLFLGDFIYVDVPLRISSSVDHYRSEYRRVYASPSWNFPGISSVPWVNTLDDHEIANDWDKGNETEPFPAASDPFIHYHVSVNPPAPASARGGIPAENVTYFQFANGPASFFMLDTRRYRTAPEPATLNASASSVDHTILGFAQLESLLTYLNTAESAGVHWKIIASSVPFTNNWRFGTSDSWGGFLSERAKVLSAMHAAESNLGVRVVVLSGDRHEFAAVRFPPPLPAREDDEEIPSYSEQPQAGPHEFSVGPLSMFYLPLRTFKQTSPEDTAIKYIPDGNSKIGHVEIREIAASEESGAKSEMRYTLWADGKRRWTYTLTSPPPGYRRRGVLDGVLRWAGVGRNST